jgi:hypothetical protein
MLVTWMSFASGERDLRGGVLSMLETHIVMSLLIFRLALILVFRLTFTRASPRTFSRPLPRTSPGAFPQLTHGPNHRSYGFGPRDN